MGPVFGSGAPAAVFAPYAVSACGAFDFASCDGYKLAFRTNPGKSALQAGNPVGIKSLSRERSSVLSNQLDHHPPSDHSRRALQAGKRDVAFRIKEPVNLGAAGCENYPLKRNDGYRRS